jgi:hypothetical protein
MQQDKKAMIFEFCKKHNLALNQAHIMRDIKDSFGEPCSVMLLTVDDHNRAGYLDSKTQLFCTDTLRLGNQRRIKISSLRDLPYYQDHEKLVNEFYENIQKSNQIS